MRYSTERTGYTVPEVAELLNVRNSTVWRWIRSGRLRAYHIGSRNMRVRTEELRRLDDPNEHWRGSMSLAERREQLLRPLTDEERVEQQQLFEKVMVSRKGRSIAPLTSEELVRRGRDRDFWYEAES